VRNWDVSPSHEQCVCGEMWFDLRPCFHVRTRRKLCGMFSSDAGSMIGSGFSFLVLAFFPNPRQHFVQRMPKLTSKIRMPFPYSLTVEYDLEFRIFFYCVSGLQAYSIRFASRCLIFYRVRFQVLTATSIFSFL
jgi:hypothetical protein